MKYHSVKTYRSLLFHSKKGWIYFFKEETGMTFEDAIAASKNLTFVNKPIAYDSGLAHLEDDIDRFIFKNEQTDLIRQMLAEIMSVPPTSTSCERTFSTSGLIVSKIKSRMCADLADALVSLKYNLLK